MYLKRSKIQKLYYTGEGDTPYPTITSHTKFVLVPIPILTFYTQNTFKKCSENASKRFKIPKNSYPAEGDTPWPFP